MSVLYTFIAVLTNLCITVEINTTTTTKYYNQQSRERDEFACFIVPLRMAVKCKAD